jgi:hypothetical protein
MTLHIGIVIPMSKAAGYVLFIGRGGGQRRCDVRSKGPIMLVR